VAATNLDTLSAAMSLCQTDVGGPGR